MGTSETLRSVIDAGRSSKRLDELSSARVIGKVALQIHAAQQKAGAGKAVGPIAPQNIKLARSGEVTLELTPAHPLGYSAPEQIAGTGSDRRSDVFCLGTILWEALTYQRLFDAMNDAAVRIAVMERAIAPPMELNANVPAELSAICMRALARNPTDRYQSLKAMAVEIEEFLAEAGYADDDSKIAAHLEMIEHVPRPVKITGMPPLTRSARPSEPPPTRTASPSQPPPARANTPSQPPTMRANSPSQPPAARANSPSQPPTMLGEPVRPSSSGAALAAALANAPAGSNGLPSAVPTPAGGPAVEDWTDKPAPHPPAGAPTIETPAMARNDKSTISVAVPPPVNATAIEARHVEAKQPALLVDDRPPAVIVDDSKPTVDARPATETLPPKAPLLRTPSGSEPPAPNPAAWSDPSVPARPEVKRAPSVSDVEAARAESSIEAQQAKPVGDVTAAVDALQMKPIASATEAKPVAAIEARPVAAIEARPGVAASEVKPVGGVAAAEAKPVGGVTAALDSLDRAEPTLREASPDTLREAPPAPAEARALPASALVEALPTPVRTAPAVDEKLTAKRVDDKVAAKPVVETKSDTNKSSRASSQSDAATGKKGRKSQPHPVAAVSLGPGPRESKDVLAGWGWGADTAPPDGYVDEDAYEAPPATSKKTLLYVIGGGLGVALIVTIIMVASSGGTKKKPTAKAINTDNIATATEPPAATAPTEPPPPPPTPAPVASDDAAAAATTAPPPTPAPAPTEPAKLPVEAVKTEPVKTEPAKTAAKTEPAKTEPAKIEPARTEPAKTAKTEPAKTEPAKTAKTETAKTAKTEPTKTAKTATKSDAAKTARTDATKTKTAAKTEPAKAETAEATKTEPVKSEKLDVETAYRVGLQQFARGDTAGALASLRTSLAGNPNYAPTWRGLGLVFEKMGEKDQARAAYKRYLQLAPSAGDAAEIKSRLERLGS